MPVETARSPVPAEAFEKYPNRWIAVRQGSVIADAESYEALMEDASVEPTDTVFHVPSSAAVFY